MSPIDARFYYPAEVTMQRPDGTPDTQAFKKDETVALDTGDVAHVRDEGDTFHQVYTGLPEGGRITDLSGNKIIEVAKGQVVDTINARVTGS